MAEGPSSHFGRTLTTFGPLDTYKLERLAGGLINETVRAKCKHCSFILKYAPPYIETIGPSAPFGRERQVVEAAALGVFTPWLDGQLVYISDTTDVFVPSALLHDQENHVLCLTDFGQSISLTQFLGSDRGTGVGLEHAAEIGHRVGHFFAQLHSPSVFKLIEGSEAGDKVEQNAPGGRKLARRMVVDPLESLMLLYGIPASEANALAASVMQDWDDAENSPKVTFVLGDSWTGSVLLQIDRGRLRVAVIDWEFASFDSSGVRSDVATMIAHIKLRSIAAKTSGDSSVLEACEVLNEELARSYRRHSAEEAAAWIHCLDNEAGCTEFNGLARKVCIAIGRDMIHNASGLQWQCECCSPWTDTGPCLLKSSMVHEGVEFLKVGTMSPQQDINEFAFEDRVLRQLFLRYAKS